MGKRRKEQDGHDYQHNKNYDQARDCPLPPRRHGLAAA
jgi:hypothetical protein